MDRRSALAALVACFALVALVSACASGSGSSVSAPAAPASSQASSEAAASPASQPTAPASQSTAAAAPSRPAASTAATLPLIVCPTAFGIVPAPAPKPQPAAVAVTVAGGSAAGLAVYTDNQGGMRILGPRGWSCSAQYGADGSGGVVVAPPGESVPSDWGAGWKLSADSSVQAVIGSQTSACVGCAEGQACPLFTTAAKSFQANFGRPCPVARPAAETTTQVSAGVMAFADPAGVPGDGTPSGGRNPANGVMTYYSGNQSGSWAETCTLPAASKALCTATLDYFLAAYGSR